jgi:uncharacterized lipoprotein YddW (UPF0748 family)
MKFVFKTFLLVLFSFGLLFSQAKTPTKEVRAIWVTTAWNLDWPTTSGAIAQQAEAIRILDAMKANNFNTVVLQVRARGDLIYPSTLEPWAASISRTVSSAGTIVGRNPGWNPLQFWIDEAHKRGMELHAWWNVANITYGTIPPPTVEGNVPHVAESKTWAPNQTWVKVVGTEGMFMDLGYPEARDYLVDVAMEMVRNYDIDAIHFDYIRYAQNVSNAWDQDAFDKYNSSGMTRVNWRRENINKFVRAIYDSIKAIKPLVKVGSAPVGIYQQSEGSTFNGLALGCDSRSWLNSEIHDYLAPQIYWALNNTNTPYFRILNYWVNNNTSGRHIYGGVGAYVEAVYPQIAAIIDTTRTVQSQGNVFYRYENIAARSYAATRSVYQYPANIPSMPWIDSIPPGIPQNLAITQIDDKTYELTWDKAAPGADGDIAKYYNIYRSILTVTDYEDGTNLYHITTNDDNSFRISFTEPPERNYYFSVTALDRNNVESNPSNVVSIIVINVTDLEKPSTFKLEQNYPNPFNPTTNIAYHISSRANVRLSVYNLLGQEVSVLVDAVKDVGDHLVKFDATNLSTGVYIYRIDVSTGNKTFVDHKKMLLTK